MKVNAKKMRDLLQAANSLLQVEEMMQVAHDTKKVFVRNKSSGTWQWHNRGDEEGLSEEWSTFNSCLQDAVEPYIDSSQEESDD